MESTTLSYYAEFGTTGSLCPGEAETELTWAQSAYKALKNGPPSQIYNILGGSFHETWHFQETTLISEGKGLQRAAHPLYKISPKCSLQDVNKIFHVGFSPVNQCDANTGKCVDFHKGGTF